MRVRFPLPAPFDVLKITLTQSHMKKTIFFTLAAALMAMVPARAEVDCLATSLSVKLAINTDHSKLLEIVSNTVTASPQCACEVVKAAIEASRANAKDVAAIVEAASIAAPDQMRLVSQCAVAVAPDALADVQAVLAKLDPNVGDSGSSAKSAKGGVASAEGEAAAIPNPLDFPGEGPMSPPPGPRAFPLASMPPPVIIAPPEVSPDKF